MNLRDQLQAALGSAYVIDRELTGGGMSRVFVATETAFGRQVVVKVLHPELAAEVTSERFAREIQVVAKLQQANIVPLLTAGHTGEVPFYTMPFVEGRSLRERMAAGTQMPMVDVIGILRDVARALAYAHDAGVMHRDIKPENILVSGGAAVVTDFGIAKAVTASRTQPGTTITHAGAGIGTPAYMAPEQAAGDPTTDHRADIYAFGCLAYELLAGRPPFSDTTVHELVAAHMMKTPVSVSALRADTPPRLADIVMQCLAKQPTQRPQHARELLEALEASARASAAARRSPGDAIASSKIPWIAATALLVAIVAYIGLQKGGSLGESGSAIPALAVLPFANAGGDSTQDYLADGISDELATSIGKIPGVRLASRSGAYRYQGRRDIDVREVGQALGVRYVVQGTVRRAGDQLRISAQLTDAESGVEIWSDNFNRSAQDVFKTQDDITAAIASALPGRSASRSAAGGATGHGTSDVEAYNLYLRGEFALRARRVREAAQLFEQAIARDANFARAWAGLSHASALGPYFTSVPIDSANRAVDAATERALQLDSTLAEAYMARGMARMAAWKWDEARAAFGKAMTVDPNDVQSFFQAGRFFYYVGEDSSAAAAWNRAKAIDPFSALAVGWHAQLAGIIGSSAEATREVARALEYDSTAFVISQLGARVYLRAGDNAKAQFYARKLPPIAPWDGMAAYVLGSAGDRPAAQAIVRKLESAPQTPWFGNYALAMGHMGLGDTAKTLTYLERATDAREIWATYNRVQDSMWDPVRKSTRWLALMKRVGLDAVPGAIR
jgi:TolB-like protein/tRNA A-37 threonylcarbamoyl transferase component Bud32